MAQNAVILSAGAAQALATVASRVLKRPRAVLSANEEVKEEERQHAVEVRREREAKKARLEFESNARIVPDAATDVSRERALRATATKGAVALFNAVATAQRGRGGKEQAVVDKNVFMGMLRRGVADAEEEVEKEEKKADWLKDDYLTKNSRKLKQFDKVAREEEEDDEDDDEEEVEYEEEPEFDDEAEFENESEDED